MVKIEIVYALAAEQTLLELDVAQGCTVKEAIVASTILEQFPKLDLDKVKVGVFSKKVGLEHVLEDGDRIEFYRSLTIDPKEARRIRAKNPSS